MVLPKTSHEGTARRPGLSTTRNENWRELVLSIVHDHRNHPACRKCGAWHRANHRRVAFAEFAAWLSMDRQLARSRGSTCDGAARRLTKACRKGKRFSLAGQIAPP
jgi:hypothetical protein